MWRLWVGVAFAVWFAFGYWCRGRTHHHLLRRERRLLRENRQLKREHEGWDDKVLTLMDGMWQEGRRYGQHEHHACDPECMNWAFTLLTHATTTDPRSN